jgi:hypothetical protein
VRWPASNSNMETSLSMLSHQRPLCLSRHSGGSFGFLSWLENNDG